MKLRRILAASAAAVVAASAMSVASFAAIKDYPDGYTFDVIAEGYDVTDVYGFKFVLSGDINGGAGGGVGVNSLSTDWVSYEWGNADAGKTYAVSDGELLVMFDEPIFVETDATDPENPYAQIWLQHWWGNDIAIEDFVIYGADGAELAPASDTETPDEPVVDEPIEDETPSVIAPAPDDTVDEPIADEPIADEPIADEPIAEEPIADEPAADEPADGAADAVVDTDNTTETGKDAVDTGVEGIAAVAGVVALAGAAVVASRKRK